LYKIIKYFVRYLLDHNNKQAIITLNVWHIFSFVKRYKKAFFIRSISDLFLCPLVCSSSAEKQIRFLCMYLFLFFWESVKTTFSFSYNLSHIFSLDYFETTFIVAERKIIAYINIVYQGLFMFRIPRFNYHNMSRYHSS